MSDTKSYQHASVTTVDDKTYHGIIVSVDETTGKIVLKSVFTDGTKLPGLHNFFVSNVKNLEFTDGAQGLNSALSNTGNGKKGCQKPMHLRKDKPRHLNGLLRFDSDQLVRSPCKCAGEDSGDQGIGSAEESEIYEDFCEINNFTIFHRSCEKFRDTITHLMKQSVIAVTFYGVSISRTGTLSLIQVATEKSIVMFDILRLGSEGFIDGLQAVLESEEVLKVVHDCRMVSDLLYHQYDVTLSKVFDTQVAASFVSRLSNKGDWPRFVDGLPSTLKKYLQLNNEDVYFFFSRESRKDHDEEMWLQRPLCRRLLQDTCRNLSHLLPLHGALQELMLAEFHIGVQLYLDAARGAPDDRVDMLRSSSHLLPFVFQDLPQLVAHSVRHNQRVAPRHSDSCYDSHGFLEVCQNRDDNEVTTSRDSIWHRKKSSITQTSSSCCSTSHKLSTQTPPVQRPVTTQSAYSMSSPLTHTITSPSPSKHTQIQTPDLKISSSSNCRAVDVSEERHVRGNPDANINTLASRLASRAPSSQMPLPLTPHHLQAKSFQNMEELDRSSCSEDSLLFSHSGKKTSALVNLVPAGADSSPYCSDVEPLSDAEIVDLKEDIHHQQMEDFDVDKILEFEMSQNILHHARQEYSRSRLKPKSRLLLLPPAKLKHQLSPRSGHSS